MIENKKYNLINSLHLIFSPNRLKVRGKEIGNNIKFRFFLSVGTKKWFIPISWNSKP
jgi:hypothetical protein